MNYFKNFFKINFNKRAIPAINLDFAKNKG